MESLIQIIDKLKQPELRMLRSFYKIRHNREPSKKLILLNLVASGKVKTDKEALKKLYGDAASGSSYSHLKERLKNDLLNTILFLNPEKIYETAFLKKKLECRKLIIQSELMLNRSGKDIANDILLKALSIAMKFEFPDLEIQIRDILRSKREFKMGFEAFQEHNERIEKCINLQRAILKTKEHYYHIQISNSTSATGYEKYQDYVRDALKEIKGFIEETNSAQVKYWYYMIAVSYHIGIEKDFEKGLELQKEFISLVEKEIGVRSKSAIAGGNMQLADVYLAINEFEKALEPALKAVKTFRKDSFNYLLALEILFWAYLRNKNLKAAEETLEKGFQHKYIERSPYFSAKWKYLKANLMFLKGNLSAAHDFLIQSDELTKDKAGWLIGFKLLLIYITFEHKNFYWLESQLENFRKLLQRNKQADIKRAKVIHKVAYALLQAGGDFKKVKESNNNDLKLLQAAKDDMHWDPTGYEVVRFDDWFQKNA